jgi:hypothetical protein
MKISKMLILVGICLGFCCNLSFGESIRDRFSDDGKIIYKVSFSGIPSGTIEWQYMGREFVGETEADVLFINSDTKILKIMSLESKEKVFIDSQTRLPLKVERDLVFFGKKEIIQEIYNQEDGYVKIIRKDGDEKEEILYQKAPIHNILALLYFFPEDIAFEENKLLIFNLPTQKIKIRMVRERLIKCNGKKMESYFLRGHGAKKFNLWLDKETRLPLRLEFLLPLGKVVVTKKTQAN